MTGCGSATINGNTYTTSQVVTDVFPGGAANGCDSIVITDLTINMSSTNTVDTTIADGSSYTVGSSSYTTSGTYVDSLMSAGGCDSTKVALVVIPTKALSVIPYLLHKLVS